MAAVRERVVLRRAGIALLALGASVYVSLTAYVLPKLGDYPYDAGPPIRALAGFHLGRFLALEPMMGAASLLVRAPCAALSHAVGGGEQLAYRLGILPCALAVALVTAALIARMARRRRSLAARVLVLALVAFCPATGMALSFGHPEELLVGALAVASVLLAANPERTIWAGIVLGLTLATKQWAPIVFLPVLLAVPRHRLRVAAVALSVAGALTAPQLLAHPSSYATHAQSLATVNNWVSPANVWWLLAQHRFHHAFLYSLPNWVNPLPHPLVMIVGAGLGVAALIRRRRTDARGAMELVALVLLVRCVLDSWTAEYYYFPFLLAIVARDALARRGLPVLSAVATWMVLANYGYVPLHGGSDLFNAFNLTWTLAIAAWLGLCALAPARAAAVRAAIGRRLAVSPRLAPPAADRSGLA